jgi:hypothetical protein
MLRRFEDRIRRLCAELMEESDHTRVQQLSGKLRSELHTYVNELRKQFAVYPGVQAYRRSTDAVPNAPPLPHIPEAAAPSPIIHPKPEVTIEASGDKNGLSEVKAS